MRFPQRESQRLLAITGSNELGPCDLHQRLQSLWLHTDAFGDDCVIHTCVAQAQRHGVRQGQPVQGCIALMRGHPLTMPPEGRRDAGSALPQSVIGQLTSIQQRGKCLARRDAIALRCAEDMSLDRPDGHVQLICDVAVGKP